MIGGWEVPVIVIMLKENGVFPRKEHLRTEVQKSPETVWQKVSVTC